MTDYSPLINRWYQAVQFRNGPFDQVASMNRALQNGAMTQEQVQQYIIEAPYTTSFVNPVIRYYQTAFNRVPDQVGEQGWINALANGSITLSSMAVGFANSSEFAAIYNANATTKANVTLVNAFYDNILCRTPGQAEVNAWINAGTSAAAMLEAFASSLEFGILISGATRAYQQAEINGSEALPPVPLFFYGGCGRTNTITLNASVQTYNITQSFKVYVDAIQQPVGSTWVTGDVISGGAATIVRLQANGNPGSGPAGSRVTLDNIQSLDINLTDHSNLDASNFSKVGTVAIVSAVDGKVLTVDAASLSSTYAIDVARTATMKFGTFANAGGLADQLTLQANGAGASSVGRASFDVVGDNQIEIIALNSLGNNYLNLATGSNAKKIWMDGSGSADLAIAAGASGLVPGSLAVFDASAFNGDLVVKFDAGATSGLASLPNITGSMKSNNFIFERAFDNSSDIAITLNGSGVQRLSYSDGGILTKTYDIFGGNGQFFISSDGTSSGSAFTNGDTGIRIGNGDNYINLGSGNDGVQVGNGSNTVYTGAGSDLIELGTGSNTVCGGAGADLFYTGGSHVTSLYTAAGQTGSITATGATVATSNFDHYWGVRDGYTLQFTFLANGFSAGTKTSTSSVAGINNAIVYVRGNETIVNSVDTFIADANGRDTLVVFDTDATAGTAFEAVVFNAQYAASSTVTQAPTPAGGTIATVQGTVIENAVTATFSNSAYVITSNYAPSGRIAINGDGTVSSSSTADKINRVGTASPATLARIDASGLLGVNGIDLTIDGAGASVSSIVGSAGGDIMNIVAHVGPVTITGGEGIDGILIDRSDNSRATIQYTAANQTGRQNTIGTNVDGNAFDEYMNLKIGDQFNFTYLSGFAGGVKISTSSVAGSNDSITFVQGTYANGLFTAQASTTSDVATLVVYDTLAGASVNYEAFILVDGLFGGTLSGSTVTLVQPVIPVAYKLSGVYSGTAYNISSTVPVNGTLTVDANGVLATSDPSISAASIQQPTGFNQAAVTSIDASSVAGSPSMSLIANLTVSAALSAIKGTSGNDSFVLTGAFKAMAIDGGLGTANEIRLQTVGQTITDAQFANVKNIQSLYVGEIGAAADANNIVLGTNASAAGLNYVRGNIGNDIINASAFTKAITIVGGDGQNVLNGGSASDTIISAGGSDTIHGNDGNDVIQSVSRGSGSLYGDAGNDQFVFDKIANFSAKNFISGGAANERNELVFAEAGTVTYVRPNFSAENIQIVTLAQAGVSSFATVQGTGLDTVQNLNQGSRFTLQNEGGVNWNNAGSASAVSNAGDYFYHTGAVDGVLTYWDTVLNARETITLVGVGTSGSMTELNAGGFILLAHR
jgi:hypothetical protein